MWWGIGFGGFFLYLVLVFTLGLMTLRKTGTDGCSSSGSSSRSSGFLVPS
jgi:hypothetical protein